MDRIVLLTGASSGIGRAIAHRLAVPGTVLVLAARRGEELAVVKAEVEAAGGSAITVVADVAKLPDIDELVAATLAINGRVDVLLNVAGIGAASSINTPDERIVQMLDINLLAPIRLMREVLVTMRAQGSGAIINIGSVAGEIGVNGVYSATKFGLRGITDSVRREVAGTGVQVSLIEPGYIATPLTASRSAKMPGPEVVVDAVMSVLKRPRRRIIVPLRYRFAVFFATMFPLVTDRAYAGRAAKPQQPADS
jgi:short-subunit dehydrogenase